MPLSNSQYDSIIRTYEEKQNRNRYLLEERRNYVYQHIDGYRELEESTASLSVEKERIIAEKERTIQILMGNTGPAVSGQNRDNYDK